MNTYLRILSYAKPLGKNLPLYLAFTLISVVFGAVNLVLLIPLLKILFDEITPEFIEKFSHIPEFEVSLDYATHLFNYYFLNALEQNSKLQALYFVCAIIILSVFIANIFSYFASIILAKIRANVIQKIRVDIFENVTRLDMSFFTNERKGDVMSRITNDVQEVELSVVSSMRIIFREPLQIVAFLVTMLLISYPLTLFAVAYMVITGLSISEITRRLKKKATESQESLGRLVGALDETLTGMRIVKAFNALKQVHEKFRNEVRHYARINVSMAFKNELASPLSQFLGVSVVAGLVIYGGSRVLAGQLDGSEFIAFIGIFSQVLNPAKAISKEISSIQRGLASGERIFSMTDIKPKVQESKNPLELKQFEDTIRFENVYFVFCAKGIESESSFSGRESG